LEVFQNLETLEKRACTGKKTDPMAGDTQEEVRVSFDGDEG